MAWDTRSLPVILRTRAGQLDLPGYSDRIIKGSLSHKIYSFVKNDEEALSGAIRGFIAAYPQARYNRAYKVVYRLDQSRQGCDTILSRGSSSHDLSHVGYVGQGLLDAAVCGAIFASPSALQVEAALKLTQSPQGTLMIVENYAGDKMNFTLAAERFRFASGAPLRLVAVADDVSINRTRCAKVGRRGLAGTVLVHKVAGSASAAGLGLDDIAGLAEFTTENDCGRA
ncbi:Dak1 domain-containing protein [Dactylonectria macrodidyma]|uniref:Dak1 domain-containing protein n=1 Tax=Dactylonectria macrodidyma TaxID=307937 RepID=A0A9P9E5A0_9HYPO|nr:Dak1 domain-containing protein [Dactylonectria macrodidyma]